MSKKKYEEPIYTASWLLGDTSKDARKSLEKIFCGNQVQSNNLKITPERITQVFREKILSKNIQNQSQVTWDGYRCFEDFFVAANAHLKHIWRNPGGISTNYFVVKVIPEKLLGFDQLWTFIMSDHQYSGEDTINFLAKVYSGLRDRIKTDLSIFERFVDRCFQYLNTDSSLKSLKLISSMMDHSEKSGIGNIFVHSMLGKSELIYITVVFKGFKATPLNLTMRSNSSLFELLEEIAAYLQVDWYEFSLFQAESSQEIGIASKTSLTFFELELGATGCENFVVHKRKISLMLDDEILIPRIEKAFTTIFEEYSDNGKMSPEQFAAFDHSWNHGGYHPVTSAAVIEAFLKHDSDKDGYLSLADFLRLSAEIAMTKPVAVWKHLETLKIHRDDMKDLNNHKIYCYVNNTISCNQMYFDSIFSLLNSERESIAFEAWKLLNRLPTKQKLFEDIIRLKGVRDITDPKERDWNSIIDLTSKYRINYSMR